MSKEEFMSDDNKKRLIKDIVDIMKSPLTDNGIFYTHDQNNRERVMLLLWDQKIHHILWFLLFFL